MDFASKPLPTTVGAFVTLHTNTRGPRRGQILARALDGVVIRSVTQDGCQEEFWPWHSVVYVTAAEARNDEVTKLAQ